MVKAKRVLKVYDEEITSEESEVDDEVHNELLREIKFLDEPEKLQKSTKNLIKKSKTYKKVDLGELLGSIKSTRNVEDLKKKLLINFQKPENEEPKKKEKEEQSFLKKKGVLVAPLHRQAKARIEGEIAYRESKRELNQWNSIVNSNRVAEQIVFPLNEDSRQCQINSADDKVKSFQPRTELDYLMGKVLGKSKYNILNKDEYSEAEKEIIKSMNLKEAQKKCADLQKMRVLMNYRARKMKQQSKIKSKLFHRIKNRQQRRQLIKETEELLLRDPEAAKEKLKELEKDRAFERATLKHRGISKFNKTMKQFAAKNPEMRKLMDEHIRYGRELKSRHNLEDMSDSDEGEDKMDDDKSNEKKVLTVGELVNLAVEQAEAEIEKHKNLIKPIETASSNPFHKSALENFRMERKKVLKKAKMLANIKNSTDGNTEIEKVDESLNTTLTAVDEDQLILKSANKNLPQKLDLKEINFSKIDTIKLDASFQKKKNLLQLNCSKTTVENLKRPLTSNLKQIEGKTSKKSGLNEMFKLDSREIVQIPDDLENAEEDDTFNAELQNNFLAEAYKDDDILGDFVKEKEDVEKQEKAEDLDLTLHGWGSWTGPGMVDHKKDRYIIKAKEVKRKDAAKGGLIIRETMSKTMTELQPREVPFPFTSARDYEIFIQQPLGSEWNSPLAQQGLIQPTIVTKAGRIIKPMEKNEKKKMRLDARDSDSD